MLRENVTKYIRKSIFYKNVFKMICTLLRLYYNADSIILLFSPEYETVHVLSI